jgi:hypothetical protein
VGIAGFARIIGFVGIVGLVNIVVVVGTVEVTVLLERTDRLVSFSNFLNGFKLQIVTEGILAGVSSTTYVWVLT